MIWVDMSSAPEQYNNSTGGFGSGAGSTDSAGSAGAAGAFSFACAFFFPIRILVQGSACGNRGARDLPMERSVLSRMA